MPESEIILMIIKILIINIKNFRSAIKKAKSDDGKISSDELDNIFLESIDATLDDLPKVLNLK
jgi:hypothetical protein